MHRGRASKWMTLSQQHRNLNNASFVDTSFYEKKVSFALIGWYKLKIYQNRQMYPFVPPA